MVVVEFRQGNTGRQWSRSGREHWPPMVAVEVMAGNTGCRRLRLRSGRKHHDFLKQQGEHYELAIQNRQARRPFFWNFA